MGADLVMELVQPPVIEMHDGTDLILNYQNKKSNIWISHNIHLNPWMPFEPAYMG